MADDEAPAFRFFKILMPGFATKLVLPCGFNEHNNNKGGTRRETATLVSPIGKTWKVDLFRGSKYVYMGGEGWRDFTVANKLGVGYLLVFHYKGNRLFAFRAFDLSTREVSYSSSIAEKGLNKKETISDNNANVTGEPPRAPCMKRNRDQDQSVSKRKRPSHGTEKARFEVTIEACNLSRRRCCMQIPAEFKTFYSLSKELEEANIRDPRGRVWPIGLFNCTKSHTIYISKGWLEFARANELKEGSKCIFELVPQANTDKPIMSVEIFNSMPSKGRFEATIRASNLNRPYMNIPIELMKSSWLKKCEKLKLRDPKGRNWHVGINRRCKPSWRATISTGWRQFAHNNQLEEGDRCIFELVSDGQKNCMQVQIFKDHKLEVNG